jgi:hypothetical protein
VAAAVRAGAAVAAVAAAAVAAGARGDSKCDPRSSPRRPGPARRRAIAGALFWAPAALAQRRRLSPEAAMNAFGDAVATSDDDAVKALLGADYHEFIPPVGAEVRYRFLAAWAKSHAIKAEGDAKAYIAVGGDGWTMPIPMVKTAQGWRFDTRAGAEEMRLRRIGRNELAVMQVMLAIYDAQKEYARIDRNRNGVLQYAAKFASAPGRQDGLYWPTKTGESESPLGPVFTAARPAVAQCGLLRIPLKLLSRRARTPPAARA